MTDKTISEKCETLYNKLNSFVTSVINRDVTPQINNLESSKADIGHTHTTNTVVEINALSNIGTKATARQSVVNRAVDNKIGSLSTSITNFNSLNTWEEFWADGDVHMYVNKAIGVGYLHFNKNVTIGANNSLIVHSEFNSTDEKIQYCPNVGTYLSTSIGNVFILVNYQGRITVFNRSSSAISNANVQGQRMWRAKGYPI